MLLSLVLLSVVLHGCSGPPLIDRAASPEEGLRLQEWMRADAPVSWSGRGWAHIDTPEGEFEGHVELNVESPTRARLVFETKAAFGLVSERFAVALPGDGWVVTHRKRGDVLERVPFAESHLRRLLPLGQPADVFALASGVPPWPEAAELERLRAEARVVRVENDGRTLTYRLRSADATDAYLLRLDRDTLTRFDWNAQGEPRLQIEYHEWATQDGLERPAVLRIAAPQSSVTAEVTLDEWRRRDDFTDADFEVY